MEVKYSFTERNIFIKNKIIESSCTARKCWGWKKEICSLERKYHCHLGTTTKKRSLKERNMLNWKHVSLQARPNK